jgi:hypothetical protein
VRSLLSHALRDGPGDKLARKYKLIGVGKPAKSRMGWTLVAFTAPRNYRCPFFKNKLSLSFGSTTMVLFVTQVL